MRSSDHEKAVKTSVESGGTGSSSCSTAGTEGAAAAASRTAMLEAMVGPLDELPDKHPCNNVKRLMKFDSALF